MRASGARTLAGIAIVVGLCGGGALVSLGFLEGLGGLGGLGDCGAGCQARHAELDASSQRHFYGGLIGGGVLVVGGILTLVCVRRSAAAPVPSISLPRARAREVDRS
jgi:hypothetical protein